MHSKHNEPRKPKQEPPSTGMGAASALDALIKKRMPAPEGGLAGQGGDAQQTQHARQPPQEKPSKHSKKH